MLAWSSQIAGALGQLGFGVVALFLLADVVAPLFGWVVCK